MKAPGIWQGIGWALASTPGGATRLRLAARMAWAVVRHPSALRRWMAMV